MSEPQNDRATAEDLAWLEGKMAEADRQAVVDPDYEHGYTREFVAEQAAAVEDSARYRRILNSLRAQTERWQLFGSAPAADLPILVYREDAGVFVARFCEDEEGVGQFWFSEYGEGLTGDLPTHWMPLPPLPPTGIGATAYDEVSP